MIMFKSNTIKLFSFSFILLLFTGGCALYLGLVLETEGEKLVGRLQAVRDHELLARRHAEFKRQLEDTKESREILNSYVLQGESGTIDLLSTFDEISSDLGIEVDTRELAVDEVSDDFHDLLITLTIEGREASVIQFLKLLESLPYRSQVSEFSASRQDGQLGVDLVIVVSIKPSS